MKILDDIPFSIDAEAVFARLHLPRDGDYAGEIHALIDSARPLARPRALYRKANVQQRHGDAVVIGASGPGSRRQRDSKAARCE
jgi:hypothetical protein